MSQDEVNALRVPGNSLYMVVSTTRGNEFATADAINAIGPLAIVPRKVDTKKLLNNDIDPYLPFLPNLIFLVIGAHEWAQITRDRLFWMKPQKNGGPPVRTILPPIRRELDILPRTWASFQDFAARAETECEYRRAMHERGKKVRNMRPGDVVRIIGGDMLDGQLRDHLAKFVRMERGQMLVETGVQIMGKPVMARVRPDDVVGVHAK